MVVGGLFVLIAGSVAMLDKMTMYHVNPARFGPVPRDTDTADVAGIFSSSFLSS